jgi:hypothetical protein
MNGEKRDMNKKDGRSIEIYKNEVW